jgi:hypothetical protein
MLVYIAMTYAAVKHNAVFILYASIVWAVDIDNELVSLYS